MRIQYIDAEYCRTERVIEPIRTYRSRSGETYLEAICHLRGEKRTFRLDRIASWVVEDVQERVSARPPAPAAPAASPTPLPVAPRPRPPQVTAVPARARRGGGAWGWILCVTLSVVVVRILFPSQDRSSPAPRPYVPCPRVPRRGQPLRSPKCPHLRPRRRPARCAT